MAIAWRKTLDEHILRIDTPNSHRVVGIQIQTNNRPIFFFSVYLPTHSSCTDVFRESLDYLDSLIGLYGYDNDVIILGDINADPGSCGGPMACTPSNEQGKILLKCLKRWNFMSAH